MTNESNQSDSGPRRVNLLPAFEIDNRIGVTVEFELAKQLGKLILDSDTTNTALLALGHQLRNLTDAR